MFSGTVSCFEEELSEELCEEETEDSEETAEEEDEELLSALDEDEEGNDVSALLSEEVSSEELSESSGTDDVSSVIWLISIFTEELSSEVSSRKASPSINSGSSSEAQHEN